MGQATGFVDGRTRSNYPASKKHYHYEGASGYGDNENIVGYSPE